jgi:6-phosphofructokinase 1
MTETSLDFTIPRLGECSHASPMTGVRFANDRERLIFDTHLDAVMKRIQVGESVPAMEVAGPRERLFFHPDGLACGIVTCGGLCPGMNDVIRAIVLSLYHHYGVRTVYGFRYGYEGLVRPFTHEPLKLTPESVERIHEFGGTILGTSRGPQDAGEMVATLKAMGISILFAIGGDGTLKGARLIAETALRQGLLISVIGIPKTIDNDISFLQKTFGFETAVAEAQRATTAANIEAEAAVNGVGLVKLMGRDSGFIAAFTVLVSSKANFCLVPEVPFGMGRFLQLLEDRLRRRGHALIVVAEGAGQEHLAGAGERDASGNVKHGDIGLFLRDAITGHFKATGKPITLKYIDPSYTIRSVPANPHDSAFCLLLGQCAVHAGMSGRTDMVVGFWNHRFTHVPIALAVSRRKKIDPGGELWSSVLASTGQPPHMTD